MRWLTAALVLAILALGTPAWANAEMGDLSALPGCSGQCHVNGGFMIDPETGEKVMLKKKKKDANCKTRTKCGPVFCQKMKTCCNDDGECVTKPAGKPFPNPDAEEDTGDGQQPEDTGDNSPPEPDLTTCATFDLTNGGGGMGCKSGKPICETRDNKKTCCCPKAK